jgi:azurin
VKEAATKTPSPLSTVILKALTSGPAAAVVEESEADLAKTHQVFRIKSTVGTLKYDVVELNVTAGKPVAIIYENPDALQHNLIIGAPGSFEKLGAAADGMMTNPQGFAKSFVPDLPEVLAKCKLLDPGQKTIVKFTPEKAGDYPFLCTFPAHWRVMHGIVKAK